MRVSLLLISGIAIAICLFTSPPVDGAISKCTSNTKDCHKLCQQSRRKYGFWGFCDYGTGICNCQVPNEGTHADRCRPVPSTETSSCRLDLCKAEEEYEKPVGPYVCAHEEDGREFCLCFTASREENEIMELKRKSQNNNNQNDNFKGQTQDSKSQSNNLFDLENGSESIPLS